MEEEEEEEVVLSGSTLVLHRRPQHRLQVGVLQLLSEGLLFRLLSRLSVPMLMRPGSATTR